jgi:hypothetical protein
MEDTDKKVEDWVKGLASSVRASPTAGGGLENLSLTAPKSRKKGPDTAAIQHITELLGAGGRARSVRYWRRVACEALGIRSMGTKRWEAIVADGATVFHVEPVGKGSNAFNTLILLELPEPEEAPAPTRKVEPEPDEPEPDSGPPKDWKAPQTLKCGHTDWGTRAEHDAARVDGKCCAQWKHGTVNWRVKGLHTAVPMNQRRSVEREACQGWPGLCCDPETNLYIGGVANDCRHYHEGPERCTVHRKGGGTPRGGGKGDL